MGSEMCIRDRDNYKYFKPKFRDTINNFVSNGKLIKDSRNTIKSFNIDNLKLNIKRFKNRTFWCFGRY